MFTSGRLTRMVTEDGGRLLSWGGYDGVRSLGMEPFWLEADIQLCSLHNLKFSHLQTRSVLSVSDKEGAMERG